jgi:nicotinic acid mononucleotide adenylyltransferase
MKSLAQVKKQKKAVFTFGRMNPPTLGHEKLIQKVMSVAKQNSAIPFIFVSQTQDAKKNPLSHSQKLKYIGLGVPDVDKYLSDEKSANTPFSALQYLIKLGYTDVIMVVGQDRVSEFKKSIGNYVNHSDPSKSFELSSFTVVSAGERDPDAEGAQGMSGTKMRAFAVDGDFSNFKKGVPSKLSDKYAREMFDVLRKNMKVPSNK